MANTSAYVLFDSGALHSFASHAFVKLLGRKGDRINQNFRTVLPSEEVLISDHWIRHVPIVICGRELFADLIIIDIFDYEVILRMDFLGKYAVKIDCRRRQVTFRPAGSEKLYSQEGRQSSRKQSYLHSRQRSF